jgi:hypothetical protein
MSFFRGILRKIKDWAMKEVEDLNDLEVSSRFFFPEATPRVDQGSIPPVTGAGSSG